MDPIDDVCVGSEKLMLLEPSLDLYAILMMTPHH